MSQRVLSGIQPTGFLHLGNYLGAISQWVQLQHTHECLFCIVDLHALTVPQNPSELKGWIRETAAAYLASGIDPSQAVIFQQSQVSAHSELSWLLSCMTPLGWLNRMTQFKEKAGKHRENASLGLYAYPVLMAADILIYQTTHVPVGDDQKQHLELARDIAETFNHRYQAGFFQLPEPLIMGPATRVMSLRDGTKKMSKSDTSDFSRIHLTDDNETIAAKVRKAKTDALPLAQTFEAMADRPEACNLLRILSALQDKPVAQLCAAYEGKTFAHLKNDLTDALVASLEPVRTRFHALMQDLPYLDALLEEGNAKAKAIASKTLQDVHGLMGLR